MPLIEALLLLLLLSRTFGEISEHFGQPAMLGEIAAGVFLGPSLLGVVHFTDEIRAVADLGVLLLVFLAGMDMNLKTLWNSFRGRGAFVGTAGFVLPMVLGFLVGQAFHLGPTRSVFIGLCVAITALPVSVRILMDLGKVQTEIGQRIISAAVFNDVTSLLILGVILDVKVKGGGSATALASTGLALVKAVAFMAGFILAARVAKRYSPQRFLWRKDRFYQLLVRLKGKESAFAIALLFVIAFASFSQVLGLQFVVGAFFGSMLISYEVLGEARFREVQKTASDITMGFLGPIFFAAIGLEFDAASLRDWWLVTAILAAAVVGKIFGGYAGGRLAKLTPMESWTVGIGLNGRGIMELVIANIALTNHFIGQRLFTALVLMAVVTTFATPFLLKIAYTQLPAAKHKAFGGSADPRGEEARTSLSSR
ncbi:MAG TPA: cation:proton antiporter [Terriglobia bacterium]|nr:cation:proton antiporter [Terriglobia bacterium]